MCQLVFSRLSSNEVLHNLQFVVVSRLKSAGIMENITVMIGENKLILNAVLATLGDVSVVTDKWCYITNLHGWIELNLMGS
jgi:hypothetical protein